MKIGYIQYNPIFGEKEKNFEQVNNLIGDTNADLLVLPELFATGYTFASKKEVEALAEDLEGQTAQFLFKLSKKTKSTLVAGFVEKDENSLYNSAMIVNNSKVLGVYRKIHLYYKEKLWFLPGNKKPKIYKINDVNIGIMICFDWIFPETARSLALLGADIIAHPANLVLPYCQKAMVTRCLENRVYAVTSNRIGVEKRGDDNFKFTGCSQITSYNGEILSSAPEANECIDIVNIDYNKARDKNLNEFNNIIEDRRENFYYSSKIIKKKV
ncbi:MAG: nitrilase-related carbon-nitrogen hydrolase [Candidatus Odinarchaeota archaeon]